MIPNYQYKTEWMEISAVNMLNFPAHFHLELEFLYVIRGRIKVQVGGEYYILNKGDFIIIFPNLVHSYFTESDEKETYLIVLNCVPDILDEYKNTIMFYRPKLPLVRAEKLHPDVKHSILAILSMFPYKNQNRLLIKAYFLLFAAHIWLHLDFEPSEKLHVSASSATQIVFYLSEHFTEEVTLEKLSRELGINRYTLSRVFSQTIKCSFRNYLHQLRIEHSKKLLNCTDMSIYAIAGECGFGSQQTFNRVFKELSGGTPSEYRRQPMLEDLKAEL